MSIAEEVGKVLLGAGVAAAKAVAEGASREAALLVAIEHIASERAKAKFPDLKEE